MAAIDLLNGVAAFLKRDGQYLLMKRAENRLIAPGCWSGVGGHIEPQEFDRPLAACLREIEEETSITQEHIFNLVLHCIILRRAGDTVRQSYIYFGETNAARFVDTDEGKLYWVPESQLLDRRYTQTFAAMLAHYTAEPGPEGVITVGLATNVNGRLHMIWSSLEDFDL